MPVNKKSQIRIACLLRLMKEGRYPNYRLLLKEMSKLDEAGVYKLSQKTIQRDVKYLVEELHAPIEYSPEHRGYYLTNPYWTSVPITEEVEMDAAVLGAHLAETILPPSKVAKDIREGTDALWSRNKGSGEEFMLLNSLVAHGSRQHISPEVFQTVFDGWRSHTPIQVKYRRAGDAHVVDMMIEPHVLTLFDNVWYIKGHLRQSGKIRAEEKPVITLALHRMQGALLMTGRYSPDEKLIQEVNGGRLFDIPRLEEVKLHVTGTSSDWGVESFPDAEFQANKGGGMLTVRNIEEYRVLNFIMTSGGKVSVVSPEWLRAKVNGYALAVAKSNKIAEKAENNFNIDAKCPSLNGKLSPSSSQTKQGDSQ